MAKEETQIMSVDESPSLSVTLEVPGHARSSFERTEQILLDTAQNELVYGDPIVAGCLGWARRWLAEIRIAYDVACAHPEEGSPHHRQRLTAAGKTAKPQKPGAAGLKRVKHVYSANGICELDHGSGICGKVRERAPRSGSQAEKAVADDRTMPIPGTDEEGGAS